jgi:hypothetical protein
MKECMVNPCRNARAVCGPNNVCVVNAEARKDPQVWCRACFDLEFDKVKLCAKSTGGAGGADCEKMVDDVARTCEEQKCAKARQAIEDDQPLLKRLKGQQRQQEQEQLRRYNETREWFNKAVKP